MSIPFSLAHAALSYCEQADALRRNAKGSDPGNFELAKDYLARAVETCGDSEAAQQILGVCIFVAGGGKLR